MIEDAIKFYTRLNEKYKNGAENWATMLAFISKLQAKELSNFHIFTSHYSLCIEFSNVNSKEYRLIVVEVAEVAIGYLDIKLCERWHVNKELHYKTQGIVCKLENSMATLDKILDLLENKNTSLEYISET